MNTFARLGALAGTSFLALGLAAPAHAGGYTYYDKAGDVTVETCDYDTYECTDAVDPSIKEGDAIRSTVQHHAHDVELRTTYRELSAVPEGGILFAQIRTNEHVNRQIILFHDPEYGTDAIIARPNGDMVKCNLSSTVSYSRNIIDVKVPRGCLSRPRWIQAGQGYVWGETVEGGTPEAPTESDVTYIDDAQTNTSIDELRWGPKVFRG